MRAGVLRGEHLGRGEQRGLAAGVDHLQHRPQRHDGLAGADLALQQPVHRVLGGQLRGRARSPTSRCPSVSANGSRGVERGQQAVRAPAARALPGRLAAASRRCASSDLQHAAPRPTSAASLAASSRAAVGRPVDVAQGRVAGRRRPCRARSVGRQRVGRRRPAWSRASPHAAGDRPVGDRRGRRVDRDQRAGELLDRRPARRPRRAAGSPGCVSCRLPLKTVTLPANSPCRPTASSALAPRLVEERQLERAAAVGDVDLERSAPGRARIGRAVDLADLGQTVTSLAELRSRRSVSSPRSAYRRG